MRSFVSLLQAITRVLGQFCDETSSTALRWDGKAYVPSTVAPADVQAAKWWGVLTALAGMLDAQAAPLTVEQRAYLDRLLFGGMGSLNDLWLDEQRLGSQATSANSELDRLRRDLFDAFQRS
jgi:hypothetical protein